MGCKWLRRQMFRLALKGCKADDPAAAEYARQITQRKSLENENAIQDALVLAYFARRLRA